MKCKGLNLSDTMEILNSKHICSGINDGFKRQVCFNLLLVYYQFDSNFVQLMDYENSLFGSNTFHFFQRRGEQNGQTESNVEMEFECNSNSHPTLTSQTVTKTTTETLTNVPVTKTTTKTIHLPNLSRPNSNVNQKSKTVTKTQPASNPTVSKTIFDYFTRTKPALEAKQSESPKEMDINDTSKNVMNPSEKIDRMDVDNGPVVEKQDTTKITEENKMETTLPCNSNVGHDNYDIGMTSESDMNLNFQDEQRNKDCQENSVPSCPNVGTKIEESSLPKKRRNLSDALDGGFWQSPTKRRRTTGPVQ